MSIGSLPALFGNRPATGDLATQARQIVAAVVAFLTRPRRVVGILMIVWTLNVADLSYTMQEAEQRLFRELNPVAAHIIQGPAVGLILYKLSLVTIGSAILIQCRRHRIAELSCWFLLAVYGYVGLRWNIYYRELTVAMNDPAVLYVESPAPASHGSTLIVPPLSTPHLLHSATVMPPHQSKGPAPK